MHVCFISSLAWCSALACDFVLHTSPGATPNPLVDSFPRYHGSQMAQNVFLPMLLHVYQTD